ncbi:unnamed protein product [Phytophthora fragariaefolia]|uniref:Unnamed protein product n=1 Tax=Phytophthora fragariaefolia TaxID=1490495 RepID=A0A9W6TYU1_9STRA|nr:unnamed protein product [Phytophthora fragariaefolia]
MRSLFRSKCPTKWRDEPRRYGAVLFVCVAIDAAANNGFYSIGTVRTDRQGLSTKLIPKKKKGDKKKPPKIPKNRPANIERDTFIVADSLHVSAMRVLRWWDTRAVHVLSTGGSVQQDRIVRRDALSGEQQEVACPRVVKDYQTYMGGVDVHDQLRLQR